MSTLRTSSAVCHTAPSFSLWNCAHRCARLFCVRERPARASAISGQELGDEPQERPRRAAPGLATPRWNCQNTNWTNLSHDGLDRHGHDDSFPESRSLEPTRVRWDDHAETHECKKNCWCELGLEATRGCRKTSRNKGSILAAWSARPPHLIMLSAKGARHFESEVKQLRIVTLCLNSNKKWTVRDFRNEATTESPDSGAGPMDIDHILPRRQEQKKRQLQRLAKAKARAKERKENATDEPVCYTCRLRGQRMQVTEKVWSTKLGNRTPIRVATSCSQLKTRPAMSP